MLQTILLAAIGLAAGLTTLPTVHRPAARHVRGAVRMASDPNLDLPDEKDDLAAAFAARLNQEGGATRFKIKSAANDLASEFQVRHLARQHAQTQL